jgi:hypothetical protein
VAPAELLGELRALLRAGEAWLRVEGGDARAEAALDRCRHALAADRGGGDLVAALASRVAAGTYDD